MKGIVLAGGLGTRLYPLTFVSNKHLLPIYNQPMVFYPIQTLVKAGITEIMVVTGGPHAGHFLRVLKNGEDLGVKHLEYAYQEKEGGIAQALSLCRTFADEGPVTVILGDNTTDADISADVHNFQSGALVFLKRVPDPKRFGVPVFDAHKTIITIEEKPSHPQSDFAVTGLYVYDAKVFDYIATNKPSARGELEITDVNNRYIQDNAMSWTQLQGFWSDAGTFDSLFHSNEYWAKKSLQSLR